MDHHCHHSFALVGRLPSRKCWGNHSPAIGDCSNSINPEITRANIKANNQLHSSIIATTLAGAADAPFIFRGNTATLKPL